MSEASRAESNPSESLAEPAGHQRAASGTAAVGTDQRCVREGGAARPARRRRWLSILLGLVIFGSGCIVGAGVMGIITRNWVLEFLHHPEVAPPVVANAIERKFDLTDAQNAQVNEIVRQRVAALIAIRRETEPAVTAQIDLLDKQVCEVLDQDQRRQWHEWFDRMRRTWVPLLPPEETASQRP